MPRTFSISEEAVNIVEQITLRKLAYAREFLAASGRPRTGTRPQVRERLAALLEETPDEISKLKALLDELDAWGNQRVRLGRLPDDVLSEFRSDELVLRKISQTGMGQLVGGQIPVSPPMELSPVRVSYDEDSTSRLLLLFAAKTRLILQAQPDIPDYTDEEKYPGVIFKPYKQETQKAVAFAEIDLSSGLAIISTTLLKQGLGYKAEFEEFYEVFDPLISFDDLMPLTLYDSVHKMRHVLTSHEVRIRTNRKRTSSGGTVDHRSHSSKVDLRHDPELVNSEAALIDLPGLHCNCYWEPGNGLSESVHTHVFAPSGEVSIMGQVKEESARYVLHRILSLN